MAEQTIQQQLNDLAAKRHELHKIKIDSMTKLEETNIVNQITDNQIAMLKLVRMIEGQTLVEISTKTIKKSGGITVKQLKKTLDGKYKDVCSEAKELRTKLEAALRAKKYYKKNQKFLHQLAAKEAKNLALTKEEVDFIQKLKAENNIQ